jgi:hypothetical protein
MEGRYKETIQWLESLPTPLVLYRALQLRPGDKLDFEELGVCWTPDEDSAEAYNAGFVDSGGGLDRTTGTIILRAKADPRWVDWDATIVLGICDPQEAEIRMQSGGELFMTGWKKAGESQWHPMEEIYPKPTDPDMFADDGTYEWAMA